LDANVLIDGIVDDDAHSLKILTKNEVALFTNEYALKEFRRVVAKKNYTPEKINAFIDHIRDRCTVLPTPSKEVFARYRLSDRSDRPIVASAVKAGCVLISHDHVLLQEARPYVKAMTAEEFIDGFYRIS